LCLGFLRIHHQHTAIISPYDRQHQQQAPQQQLSSLCNKRLGGNLENRDMRSAATRQHALRQQLGGTRLIFIYLALNSQRQKSLSASAKTTQCNFRVDAITASASSQR
jgi:hypothetical protein